MNQNAYKYCKIQEQTDYILNHSAHLPIISMKNAIVLGFNQQYIRITHYHDCSAIDIVAESTDRSLKWLIQLSAVTVGYGSIFFSFCSDSLKNMLLNSSLCYAKIIKHINICHILSLVDGILFSIYCMGCNVIIFPRDLTGDKQPLGEQSKKSSQLL